MAKESFYRKRSIFCGPWKATGNYRIYRSLQKLQNAGTGEEEEKKLTLPMAKKKLPAEGCSRRKGKWEEGSRQKKISDNRQNHDKWTVCR